MWQIKEEVNVLFWFLKPEGNRQCRRPRHRWEDNIKVDLKEIV